MIDKESQSFLTQASFQLIGYFFHCYAAILRWIYEWHCPCNQINFILDYNEMEMRLRFTYAEHRTLSCTLFSYLYVKTYEKILSQETRKHWRRCKKKNGLYFKVTCSGDSEYTYYNKYNKIIETQVMNIISVFSVLLC